MSLYSVFMRKMGCVKYLKSNATVKGLKAIGKRKNNIKLQISNK